HVCGWKMHMVGCDHRYKIHPFTFWKFFFPHDHLLIRTVHAISRSVQCLSGSFGLFRLCTECSTPQFNFSIEGSTPAMYSTDQSVKAPTDHAHSNFSCHFGFYLVKRF